MIVAIDTINQFVEGMTIEEFRLDLKTCSAVERQLLIISEALTQLLALEDDLPERQRFAARFPTVDIYAIRGLGNRLRHDYTRVNVDTIWGSVHSDDYYELRRLLLQY